MGKEYDVFERISEGMRVHMHLHVDATYKADPQKKNLSGEFYPNYSGLAPKAASDIKVPLPILNISHYLQAEKISIGEMNWMKL